MVNDANKRDSDPMGNIPSPAFRMRRFLEPCLLLLLSEQASHGYELMERLAEFGFTNNLLDPGALYRALRKMEEGGLVSSQWHTGGSGPAKRQYSITPQGFTLLKEWAKHITTQAGHVRHFLERYRAAFLEKR